MHVLIADKLEQSAIDGLKALGCQVTSEPAAGAEGLPAALKRTACDVLIVRSTKVNAAALEASPSLRAIVRAGAGVDNIDVPAATARGIRVCNCPGTNSTAVAELAMGLLIACDRRIPDQTAALKSGKWNKKEFTTHAHGLKGSMLLIIGLGAIGKALARRAAAFEMDILGWDKFLTPPAITAAGAKPVGPERAQLLKAVSEADAISIHIALVPETAKFCDAAFFAAMKPEAIFVNTSRGGVVDEAALREAVKTKGLRCGLDVYEGQPGTPQADFLTPTAQLQGCAFTHHCGASTDQAQQAVAEETVRIIRVFKQSGRLENCVNEQGLPEIKTAAPQTAPAR